MVSRIALASIYTYQRWLSPRKGYRCAYSVLHGGTGCSGYAKFAIRDYGLWKALPVIRQRFRECRLASQDLQARCAVHSNGSWDDDDQKKPRKRRAGSDFCAGCGGATCLPAGACGASGANSQSADGAAGGAECGGSDCGAPDCGGCDCSPSCG